MKRAVRHRGSASAVPSAGHHPAGLGRPEAKQLAQDLTAPLTRKFGVGWETRSDMENRRMELAPEDRRRRERLAR